MSDKVKRPREEALEVAMDLRDALAPLCHRIEIAGSIRRIEPEVSDAELVYIPKMGRRRAFGELYAEEDYSIADAVIDQWLKDGTIIKRVGKGGSTAWGKQNKLAIDVAGCLPVDFFATTEEKWWVSLVIRTGPKELNIRLATGAQRYHRKLNPYGCGFTDSYGGIIPCKSEQEVFELAGVPYLEPWER